VTRGSLTGCRPHPGGRHPVSDPLVTIGVPVYRGQDALPVTLECVRTQTYRISTC